MQEQPDLKGWTSSQMTASLAQVTSYLHQLHQLQVRLVIVACLNWSGNGKIMDDLSNLPPSSLSASVSPSLEVIAVYRSQLTTKKLMWVAFSEIRMVNWWLGGCKQELSIHSFEGMHTWVFAWCWSFWSLCRYQEKRTIFIWRTVHYSNQKCHSNSVQSFFMFF